ncbi:MAG TPA: DUF192 domain-containing protein [Polyangiaceae bacterium]|jgi:hypothetical protein|nr:DUF192 domain-containing protein [Polyangiaceae bacterium]
MRVAAVGLCFSLLLACNRSEESHSVDDAHAASAPTPAATTPGAEKSAANAKPSPAASIAPAATKCVVPLADEPARRAPNALHCPADPDHPPELAHGYVVFADAPGSPRLNVELAQSESEKERGLMYRTKLPDDQGMLFSWNNEEPRTFWMHNTCIPLDMMFIARDGTISGILEQVPTLNDEARGVPCPDAYVLEVNAGWSRAHGIKPGSVVHFE